MKTHFVFEVHVVQMTDVFSPIFFVCNRMFSLVNLQICTATHSLQCKLMEHEIAAIECRQNTHHDLPYFFMHIEDEKHHHIKLMMLFLFESTLLCKRGMDAQQHTAHCTHTLDQRSVSSSKAWRKCLLRTFSKASRWISRCKIALRQIIRRSNYPEMPHAKHPIMSATRRKIKS